VTMAPSAWPAARRHQYKLPVAELLRTLPPGVLLDDDERVRSQTFEGPVQQHLEPVFRRFLAEISF